MRTPPPFKLSDSITVLICAKGSPVPDCFDRIPDDRNITIKNEKLMGNIPPYEELQYNSIIGYVECTGVVQDADSFWAEKTRYEWENPVYNLTFRNPFMFNNPIPVRYKNHGLFFRMALDKETLHNAYKVNLLKPCWEGECLKMPVAESVLRSIEEGMDIISFDLCDTNVDSFFNPATGQSFPIESIDFIGKQRIIHKEVVSVELGHYVDEDNEPIYFRGYDMKESKIWEVIYFHIK